MHLTLHDFGGSPPQFYVRAGSGKYGIDITEIRNAFAADQALTGGAEAFRRERIAAVKAGNAPVSFRTGSLRALRVIPFVSLDPVSNKVLAVEHVKQLRPMQSSGWNRRAEL